MTVTREHAQMLTTLAVACRPHRAPTWDPAGVMAAIGRVKERDLAEVVLAVIRAASDRDVASPGVIPSNGSHWQEQLKAPKWEPTILDPAERCSVCSKDATACETRRVDQRGMDPDDPRYDDHRFTADFKAKRGEDVKEIVTAVKAELAPMREPAHAEDRPRPPRRPERALMPAPDATEENTMPRPLNVCPECQNGKHGNCDRTAWHDDRDEVVDCDCAISEHEVEL